MLNQIVIAGRLVSDPEITTTDNNKKRTYITVAVPRSYKNIDGTYDTDFIRCILWNNIASTTTEYCQVGDVIGVKGRLQSSKYEDENKKIHYMIDVIAERVTFLSTNKKHVVENDSEGSNDNKAE